MANFSEKNDGISPKRSRSLNRTNDETLSLLMNNQNENDNVDDNKWDSNWVQTRYNDQMKLGNIQKRLSGLSLGYVPSTAHPTS